jgi:hypothetical protein
VRLLGGLMLWVTTLYCSPARRTGQGRGREGSGLYPELGGSGAIESAIRRVINLRMKGNSMF